MSGAQKKLVVYQNWLSSNNKNVSQYNFEKKLRQIKDSIEKLYKEHANKPQLPYYTPHGIDHFKAVEHYLYQLLPDEKYLELNEAERFFLLGSAWVHDVGMLTGILAEDSPIPNDFDPKKIRDEHHVRSEQFIVCSWSKCGIEQDDFRVFSKLALYHRRREAIESCAEEFGTKYGTIRLQLLAAYLRLADALHIDQTRTPESAYAICLSYDIPEESKIHWIKSKFVNGVCVDTEKRQINIDLQNPFYKSSRVEHDSLMQLRIDNIHKTIIDDFKDELDSVKEILIKHNITSFLNVNPRVQNIEADTQLIIDIKGLLTNFDVLAHPSSSSLAYLILDTVKNIISSNVSLDDDPVININQEVSEQQIESLSKFLKEIEKNVLAERSCHFELKNIVDTLNEALCKDGGKDISNTVKDIIDKLNSDKRDFRIYARNYFRERILGKDTTDYIANQISDIIEKMNKNYKDSELKDYDIKPLNILLYGFSSLVINSLESFRDVIIELFIKKYTQKKDENNILSIDTSELKKISSKFFRIFICEAQPKTQTAQNGSLVFHDGINYSLAVKESGFDEIYIIPDATSGTLIKPFLNNNGNEISLEEYLNINDPIIHLILMGTNGFDEKCFLHSAGHSMIVKLAKYARQENRFPKVILTTLTNKFISSNNQNSPKKNMNKEQVLKVNGCLFRNSFNEEPIRAKMFITNDKNLQKKLTSSNIKFYNTKEDRIDIIDNVDVIIAEKGFVLKPKSGEAVFEKKINF